MPSRTLALSLLFAAAPAPAQDDVKPASPFAIVENKTSIDVCCRGRPVLRLMTANDTSDEKRAHATYKVFAHVMDPLDPKRGRTITKGAGHQFTHHRGIFVGWSKANIEGVGRVDTWHMKDNRQHFAGVRSRRLGADSATLAVAIDWVKGEQKLLDEVRAFVVHAPSDNGAVLIDVTSKVTAVTGKTVLKGDPEHAGVQFRAHQAVGQNKSAKYLFPKGKQPGNKGDRDMGWAAMQFQIGDRSYHVQHMSHPSLPKGNVYSAYRNYGRFGAYFQTTIPKGESATFRVRFYISPGGYADDARAAMDRRYAEFAESRK